MEVFFIISAISWGALIWYWVTRSSDNKVYTKEELEHKKFMDKMNEYKKESEEFQRFLKKLPKKKDGSLDYAKISPKDRYKYTMRKSTKEAALGDLWLDICSICDEINLLNKKIDSSFGGERLEIRDMIQIKKSECNELLYIYNRDSGKPKRNLPNVYEASKNGISMVVLEEYKRIKEKMESILKYNGWNYDDEQMEFLNDLPNQKQFIEWYEREKEIMKEKFKSFGDKIHYLYKVKCYNYDKEPSDIYGCVFNVFRQDDLIFYEVAFNKEVNFHIEARLHSCHSLTEEQIRMIEAGELIPGEVKFFHIRNR